MENLLKSEVVILGVVIWAIVTTIKKMIQNSGHSEILNKGWFKGYIMTPLPLVLGGLAGLIPNFLPGPSTSSKVMVGIIAGLFSSFFYNMLKHSFSKAIEKEVPLALSKEKESDGNMPVDSDADGDCLDSSNRSN